MSKPYYQLKKEYYINLRSVDAITIPVAVGGNNYKYIWNINNINVSKNAKICLLKMINNGAGNAQYTIRCPLVQNSTTFDSAKGDPIIFMSSTLTSPLTETYFNLSTQNVSSIELSFSNEIPFKNNGIPTTDFYIQLKIVDFDDEPVDADLMPTFTRSSLSYHYNTPIN